MTQHLCLTCGGALINENGAWSCKYCGNVYEEETVQRDADMMRALLDEVKTEQVANLRRNLYDAINAKYIDSEQICNICTRIKEYLPDDFMASFYYVANSKSQSEVAEYITYVDVEDNLVYIDGILKFLLRSFCSEFHLPMAGLIERAYRHTDLEKLEYYNTLLSEEAEKENLGVYETRMRRDVFVAYSSKDMESVYALVAYLEASGLKCFVASRNLRHGQGAKQNYDAALREAIMNCEAVVFVSSPNSRTFSCDAIKKELPFIKQNDINNAPYEYKQNYASMPYLYIMPRVEFRIAESKIPNAADSFVKEFFESCEFAYTPEEVGTRLIHLLEEKKNRQFTTEKAPVASENTEKKFCAECGTENPVGSKFCSECGSKEFVASRAAFDELQTRKNLAAKEKAEQDAQKREMERQKNLLAEERRKAEEEKKKIEAERKRLEEEKRKTTQNPYQQRTVSPTPPPLSIYATEDDYVEPPRKKSGGAKKFFIFVLIVGILSAVGTLIVRNMPKTLPNGNGEVSTELVGSPISTVEELKNLAGSEESFYLAEDIDLGGAEWTPIKGFTGAFNGNGHTIKNFKITSGSSNIGLFDEVTGHIMNLTVDGAEITLSSSGENVGILCGVAKGLLSNITVQGSIDAPSCENVGGIVGKILSEETYGNLEFSTLLSRATVIGEANVGGIAGKFERDSTWYVENLFTEFSNEGSVTAKKNCVGGIFGYIDTDLGYFYADNMKNSGSIEGTTQVGGIVGLAKTELIASYIKDSSCASPIKAEAACGAIAGELINVHIVTCTNSGSYIEASGYITDNGTKMAMVGGLVGKGTYATECTNSANINYEGGGSYVGGIIGYAKFSKDDETKAENLKNTGNISGADYVGGIYGYFENDCGWYRNSYFNGYENTGAITGSGNCVGGIYGYIDSEQGYVYIDSAKNSGDVTGKKYVGGIVGQGVSQLKECYIQNSSSSSSVSAEAFCGAIAGELNLIFINNCTNAGSSVEASGYVLEDGKKNVYLGGFVGKGFYASNCTNKVSLNYTGEGRYVGGIIGLASFKLDSDITMENLKNEATVSGASYVGGIIGSYFHESGWNYKNQFDVIENTGNVTGSGEYVGGCIGYADANLGYLYIDAAKNSGNVSGSKNFADILAYGTSDKTEGSYVSGTTTAGGKLCGTLVNITQS